MNNSYKINVEKIFIGIDDDFEISPGDIIKKRFYVPDHDQFFYVDVVTTKEYPNHENMAESYVKSKEKLMLKYKKFREQTGNSSYKDFLVLECDALAVADKYTNSRAEIVFKECDTNCMKKILNAFLIRGYKVVEPENPMLRGRY